LSARRNQTEGVEQAAVIAWAQSKLRDWPELKFLFHTPNGGARNVVVAGQLKAMGVKRGVPDLLLPLVCWIYKDDAGVVGGVKHVRNGLAVEMKSDTGALTPEQKEWFAHLTAQGWVCTVARSAEEAITALASYLAGDFDKIPRAEVPSTTAN